MLQIFLGDEPGAVRFQTGKARRIRNAPAKGFKDRHLTGGVAAAAQLLADGTGLALCFRQQMVQKGGFSHAGVAAERTQPAADPLLHLVQPAAGLVIDADERQGRFFVGLTQEFRLGQVALGAHDHRLHALVHCNGGQLVQHQGAGGRLGGAGHQK